VTTVGTGTCVPRLDRGGPCTLVRTNGITAVVDLGLGALRGLLQLGVRHADLNALFVTHLHPDHVAEIVSFLFAANYDEAPRERPFVIAGGCGVQRLLDSLDVAHGRWLTPRRYELAVWEMAPRQEVRLQSLICRAGVVHHIDSSLAYRFESAGRAVVISGDTGPSPELETLARGADLLIVEASLPVAAEATNAHHLSARQAGELGRRAGVGRLVLNHFYPAADAAAPEREASEAFGGPVTVARDGMELEV
jgi:ribonuclease BN (tRNA processing enzyme)